MTGWIVSSLGLFAVRLFGLCIFAFCVFPGPILFGGGQLEPLPQPGAVLEEVRKIQTGRNVNVRAANAQRITATGVPQ
jgi:hypothetical protein